MLTASDILATIGTKAPANDSWLYRILPPVVHEKYKEELHEFIEADFTNKHLTPQQMRWRPMPFPAEGEKVDFVQGLRTVGTFLMAFGASGYQKW